MKSFLLTGTLILLLWNPGVQSVNIQVGKFTYPLESVLKLKQLLEKDGEDHSVASKGLCEDPKLPEEFQPVCAEEDAADIFVKLEAIENVDECEICANPACPGCR